MAAWLTWPSSIHFWSQKKRHLLFKGILWSRDLLMKRHIGFWQRRDWERATKGRGAGGDFFPLQNLPRSPPLRRDSTKTASYAGYFTGSVPSLLLLLWGILWYREPLSYARYVEHQKRHVQYTCDNKKILPISISLASRSGYYELKIYGPWHRLVSNSFVLLVNEANP